MTKKYTPDDIKGLKLCGSPSENLQATWEFCDVLNTISARMEKWRSRHAALGAGEPASVKLQVKEVSAAISLQ
jgi:hypothetical protein